MTEAPAKSRRRASEPLAYTVTDTIVVSGMGRSTIFKEIAAGRLKAKKRGSDTLILRADLVAYLDGLPDREAAGRIREAVR